MTKSETSKGRPYDRTVARDSAKTDVVRMELAGASPGLSVEGVEQLPGVANYFSGHDSAKWRTNVKTFARVKYSAVYPGVDLVYYSNQRQLEYDFILAPNADARPVRLHFAGAETLKLNADGDLTVAAKNGEIAFHKPVVYQRIDGQRRIVAGNFTLLAGNTVGFTLGEYDHNRELVIDATLAYSTYLGPEIVGTGIAVDPVGEAVMVGTIQSPVYPGTNPPFPITVGPPFPADVPYIDVLIVKLNYAGSALLYSTYLANTDYEAIVSAVAVDTSGNAYIAGVTKSPDFVTTPGSFQPTIPSTTRSVGFVTKLDATGEVVYSTYLGGPNGQAAGTYDGVTAIALDSERHVYVAGVTSSFHFPVTSGAYQKSDKHPSTETHTGFVSKLTTDGSALEYSTYLGGSGQAGDISSYYQDSPAAIAVDSSGAAYVAGTTMSTDFPTTPGAFDTAYPSPASTSGYIAKLNPAGSALVYATYLGGSNSTNIEKVKAIAVDGSGDTYVTGQTSATDFPTTPGAFQPAGAAYSCFVTKLNPAGTALVYSTYLAGSSSDVGSAIAVDSKGQALVTGADFGADFPVTGDALVKNAPASTSSGVTFVTEIDAAGSGLVYSTYLDGNNVYSYYEYGAGVAFDSMDNAYVTGRTGPALPVTRGAFQTVCNECSAAFVAKFAFNGATKTTLTSTANPQTVGGNVTITAHVTAVSGGDAPAGLLTFNIDGISAGHVTLDEDGSGVYSTSGLPVGPHVVKANYLGAKGTFSGSGTALTETILGQVATPEFTPLGGTYRGGEGVTIQTPTPKAVIHYTTDGSNPTTGSPLYYAGAIFVGSNQTIKAIAVEPGDTSSAVATAVFTLNPSAIGGTTTLVSSANPSTLGEAVTFTATVTPTSGPTPTGSVTFLDGAAVMGVVPLTGGVASLTTSALSLYGHSITAVYTGSATNAEKGSPVFRQEVTP